MTSVRLLTGTLDDTVESFDLILANIQADVLCALAPSVPKHLAAGGHVILSGILREQAEDVITAYAPLGLRLLARPDEGEWSGLLLGRNDS